MPGLRTLSGEDLVRALERYGFSFKSQRGSHLKLARGKGEILVLPMHREIRKGTLMDIYREALRYVPEEDLRHVFFSD